MAMVKLQHIPSGHDGNGYLTLNGQVKEGFRITKVSAQLDITKESKRFLGERMTSNAARGMAGKGSVAYCHCTNALIDAMRRYQDGGDYPEITLQYWAETAGQGRCEVVLRGVVLDSVSFGALDDGSDESIINESEFSFDQFEVISRFEA